MMNGIFDSYSKYPVSRLSEIGLDRETSAFMSNVGLPNWCAPNMYFGNEESWLPAINHSGDILHVIGSDRDDCLICISSSFNIVRCKNEHQNFVATNIQALSIALHEFQICINYAVSVNSEAYINNDIPCKYLEPFVAWLKLNEPKALGGSAFWLGVLRWLKYKI